MTKFKYSPNQPLNQWVEMLHTLYGSTQNYSKTPFEVHTHLTEVCGVFGKHLFKKDDLHSSMEFLPKIFAWAVALLKTVHPDETDLEGIILRKFPGVCPYCGENPCQCWNIEKPTLDPEKVRNNFYRNSSSLRRSINDFQLMFRNIYENSWYSDKKESDDLRDFLKQPFSRMIEELAEIAESIRFYHLYPENFENELADFFAWWFAIVSCFIDEKEQKPILAEEILWNAYPGYCPYCNLIPCFCRPGPVRELMSKPPPGQDHRFDVLTALYNQGAYKEDLENIENGTLPIAFPIGCVRIDIDDFKNVNDTYGHSAGDAALRHIAGILRSKVSEWDRVYRISGDEFGILLMDTTEEEAGGMMKRVCATLQKSLVRWVSSEGKTVEFGITASIGVSQCDDKSLILNSFEFADNASYSSKEAGKDRVTLHSSL